jgi:radical SAM superfamily enzyme YgiQ (UPF0313 family)
VKTALVQCPVWWTVDPPLGLAQIAGCLKAAGHEVGVHDLNIELWKNRPPQYESMWLWEQFHFWNQPAVVDRFFADNARIIEGTVERILSSDARFVAFCVFYGSHLPSLKLAAMIKRADPSRVIVFGGQYFFLGDAARTVFANPQVDVVVRGAGDEVFPAMVSDFARTGRLVKRAGVVFRGGEGLVDGGAPPMPRTLDHIPFADFTGFPMEVYEDLERIPIAASRGCVWACRFCSTTEFWDGYSYMSGDRIFAEVVHQRNLFPSRGHVEFYDITANGKPECLARFSDLMADLRLSRKPNSWTGWKINAILRPEMTAELLRKMAAAGCESIIYGVESGSPAVLKRMNKNYSVAVAERVLKDTHDAGISATGNFMFGFPGETDADFEMTLEFLRRNHKSLDRAYGSATFTSLEEHSYLTEHQEAFDIRRETEKTAHNLYWESKDGKNTYPVRLARYKRFRETCIGLGIDAYKGVNGTLEQDHLSNLAQYYQYVDDRFAAVRAYLDYLELDLMNEPIRAQLMLYRRDLRLLARAARVAEGLNGLLPALNGESEVLRKRLAENGSAAWPSAGKPEPLSRAERALARVQGYLKLLKHRGVLNWTEGRFEILWEKAPVPPRRELESLRDRVEVVIRLAEAEAKRPPEERHVPDCAR